MQKSRKWPNDYTTAIQPQNPVNVFDQDQKHYTWKMYTIQLYTRWPNDYDFCIVKNREKNLVVWPRL